MIEDDQTIHSVNISTTLCNNGIPIGSETNREKDVEQEVLRLMDAGGWTALPGMWWGHKESEKPAVLAHP